ncbi:uncharacterized protein BKCO1_3400031 [Diplodia corticola]|uniref:F-box domain-containing protein n=1 Tax=Diplodia corticola TaxID=236234 RepID=A0A1J9QVN1_9PEZI|nr:uncharacterized protein BKCO1_3400031 [Diplodia corticola]OJD33046.1 hypothetical protein BKCO1_3400031 [Diplodia corticola]
MPRENPLEALTAEARDMILHLLDCESLKRLRLCCKSLAGHGARRLFRTIRTDFSAASMERVIDIANSEAISGHVRNLVLLNWEGWRDYEYEEFCGKIVLQDWRSRRNEHFMELLYEEYMANRDECSLVWCLLHAPRPVSYKQKEAERALTRYEQSCLGFQAAMLKFSNLKHVGAEFGHHFKRTQTWRDYQFEPSKFESRGNHASDDVYFASRLLLLQALGLRNSLTNSLTSLHLDITEELWAVGELDRFWRENDEFNACNGQPDESLIQRQLHLMEDAFTHLTDLRIGVLDNGFPTPYRDLVLPRLLRKTTKLERLHLSLPTTWHLASNSGIEQDILSRVLSGVRWQNLREVTLQVDFTFDSLLGFLLSHATMLASLTLYRCDMHGGSWPDMYRAMRGISFRKLCHLNFSECADGDPLVPPLLAFSRESTAVSHHSLYNMRELWMGYSKDIYPYILRQTDFMPPLFQYGCYMDEDSADGVDLSREDDSVE